MAKKSKERLFFSLHLVLLDLLSLYALVRVFEILLVR
jgi:hypothetical protein